MGFCILRWSLVFWGKILFEALATLQPEEKEWLCLTELVNLERHASWDTHAYRKEFPYPPSVSSILLDVLCSLVLVCLILC